MTYEFNATFFECRASYEIYFETEMPGPMTYETAIFEVAKDMAKLDPSGHGKMFATTPPIYFENAKIIGQLPAEMEAINFSL